ncbi:hypothetical protein HYH03_013689 [Edaphochlamys debaryana]|uniref:Right handed beta helix domain-containing protein n=1 Tax=Edaphochlamys debaryana TaxID=47281 RepID=A0A836BU97_9CHLO|nr:hypothetical protein HYH03_013689 [Edaphochlamys debaryana]|eukprot:KAG2487689.1 hypothetical protein HYH03_013689 [Edaphochlamys debaryana]
MGAGCSSAELAVTTEPKDKAAAATTGPKTGHIYVSYHRNDTGDQRTEHGDGAAGRVRDWLSSRGYVVVMGEQDTDATGGEKKAGVQAGPEVPWIDRMQSGVERCQAFVALVSEHYGQGSEAKRELHAADSASCTLLLPLWHSGPWPPEDPATAPLLGHLQRVPRGGRPLCRTILEGVMGELVDALQQAGVMPAPKVAAAEGESAAEVGARVHSAVAAAVSLDAHFKLTGDDPDPDLYSEVKCYTGHLQEIVDRLNLTFRPTVFDLGGNTYSGDLPLATLEDTSSPLNPAAVGGLGADPAAAAAAAAALVTVGGAPAAEGGTLLVAHPHVTFRNGTIRLRHDQQLRITSKGVLLENVNIETEAKGMRGGDIGGPHGQSRGAHHLAAGASRGAIMSTGQHAVVGEAYETGKAMLVLAGGAAVRMVKCKLDNLGRHLALWLTGGATAALRTCTVEANNGGGVWVRDAGSSLVAQGCMLQKCSGPCLLVEAGAGAQLEACSLLDASRYNAVNVGSGSRLRADRCIISGGQDGVFVYGRSTAELVGCELMSNTLQGVEVRDAGSQVHAVGTKITRNQQSGVLVAEGGMAFLTNCNSTGNNSHGLLVRGAGSMGSVKLTQASFNQQAGALITEGGRLEAVASELAGNKMCGFICWGKGSQFVANDCKITANVQAGFAIKDGGKADLVKVFVKGNRMPNEVSGEGARLETTSSAIDPKPNLLKGGTHEDIPEKRRQQLAAAAAAGPVAAGGKGGKR